MNARVHDKSALYDELRPLLRSPRKASDGRIWSFCPAHPDGQKHGRRSLSLHPVYGLDCFAGCDFSAILEALRGQGPAPSGNGTAGRIVATYEYRDASGQLVAEKARYEYADGRKSFAWRRPNGDWKDGLKPLRLSDLPLYHADLIAKADPAETVYVCEGEKAVEACRQHGLLATTHGGGSSTRDFGESLALLAGRPVALWPDNDVPGRTYMTVLESRLRGIVKSLRWVNVPLPEKGDAFDYFAAGGSVEALRVEAVTAPAVEFISDDALRVRYPTPQGTINVTLEEIERSPRALEAELSLTIGPADDAPYCQRINLLSQSQVTELRRSLQEVYGSAKEGWEWAKWLNAIFALARRAHADRDPSISAADIPDDNNEPIMLVDPLLPMDSPTIFFGDGGSAKTYVLLRFACSFAWGVPFLGLPVPQRPVLFVDYEGNQRTFKRRLWRIARGMGYDHVPANIYYWHAHGTPLSDMVIALRRKVERDGIGLLIVDSVAPACGGKPEDAEVALRYFRALQRIGVTSANIAHVTKTADSDYPFGSIFWHDEARATWFVKRVQEEDADEIDVGLFNKKENDGPRAKALGLRVSFSGLDGPVTIDRANVRDVPDLYAETPARQQVWDVLTEAMDIETIAERTGLKRDTVYKTLTRNPRLFALVRHLQAAERGSKPKSLWGRASDRDEPGQE
jgi:hypothetical protein